MVQVTEVQLYYKLDKLRSGEIIPKSMKKYKQKRRRQSFLNDKFRFDITLKIKLPGTCVTFIINSLQIIVLQKLQIICIKSKMNVTVWNRETMISGGITSMRSKACKLF